MYFDGWEPLARVLILGTLAYLALVVMLRAAVRERGLAELHRVAAIILETDGSLNVLASSGDALQGVRDAGDQSGGRVTG